jgi:hypothetical protein
VDFAGTISGLSGRCPDVTFTVGGTTVAVDAATDYKKKSDCSDLGDGRIVTGHGTTQSNGTVKATQIDLKKEKNDD